mgnify:CR=1 FL=1
MRIKHEKRHNKSLDCQKSQKSQKRFLLFDYLYFTLIVKIFYAHCKKHSNKGINIDMIYSLFLMKISKSDNNSINLQSLDL